MTPQGRPLVNGSISVWARWLSDGSAAVALYNEEDEEQTLAVRWADLGWEEATVATVRDLWAQHGLRLLWMGGSARVGLLLVVNGLNELVLKKAWASQKAT